MGWSNTGGSNARNDRKGRGATRRNVNANVDAKPSLISLPPSSYPLPPHSSFTALFFALFHARFTEKSYQDSVVET